MRETVVASDTGLAARCLLREKQCSVLFCSLAVLDPRVGHTTDVLSPFIPVLYHSDRLFHGESCPRLDVVHRGRAWPSSPACSLHYLFLQATPLFPQRETITPCISMVAFTHTPRFTSAAQQRAATPLFKYTELLSIAQQRIVQQRAMHV